MKITSLTNVLILVFLVTILSSCGKRQEVSFSEERTKILAMHNAQRDYHFNKDSIAFANQLSDNFISINNGKITSPKRKETIAKYNHYFSTVEFVKWDDVTEPIIKFSDDGSMAYTLVDKIVRIMFVEEDGTKKEVETHFAWTAIYKKYTNGWKIDCVTSTDGDVSK